MKDDSRADRVCTVTPEQIVRKIDDGHLLPWREFIALMPDARPNKARDLLACIIDAAGEMIVEESAGDPEVAEKLSVDAGGGLSFPALEVLAWQREGWRKGFPSKLYTPYGARALLRLRAAGLVDINPKKASADLGPLTDYAESLDQLIELTRTERERARAEKQAFEARLEHLEAHPEDASEEEFSWSLLNTLAFRIHGPGSCSMVLGGINVSKQVAGYSSNSGKTRDHEVVISWMGSDGRPCELTRNSSFKGNRSNDPDRNWGLPE